jgi:hypothetical protein
MVMWSEVEIVKPPPPPSVIVTLLVPAEELPGPVEAPLMVRWLRLMMLTCVVQVAVPAETLMVSPFDALLMQVCRLELSGVEVHVGLDPVQPARALGTEKVIKTAKAGNTKQDLIPLIG